MTPEIQSLLAAIREAPTDDLPRLALSDWCMEQPDPAMQARPAWNAGKMVGTKRPLTQKQIWAVRFFLDREGRLRDRALFDLAIDSKLRSCDLIKLRVRERSPPAPSGTMPLRARGRHKANQWCSCLKPARTSCDKSCGCSQAAKCPPLSSLL